MLNNMCKNCTRLGIDCQGTENQVWSGCIYRRTVKDLEKLLQKECGQYENDRTSCTYLKECDRYATA